MNSNKTITASIDEIVEALVQDLGEASEGNGYRLTTYKNKWWIEHRHVGSGEPLSQFLRTALEGLVAKDEPNPADKGIFQCRCGFKTTDTIAWCTHADCCIELTTPTEKGGEG